MAWIKIVTPARADGLLKTLYDAAMKRAGKVFNIIRIQGLHPRALRASTLLYHELMFAEGPLTRPQREMIAVTVSRANDCHY